MFKKWSMQLHKQLLDVIVYTPEAKPDCTIK